MTTTHNEEPLHQTVTSGQADLTDLRARLVTWLSSRPEVAGEVEVSEVTRSEASGMSNISILFDASRAPAQPGGEQPGAQQQGGHQPGGASTTSGHSAREGPASR